MDWRSACVSSLGLLSACAPLAEMRPAGGAIESNKYELGTAGIRLGPRPYVEEDATRSGMLWLSADASRRFTFTGITVFDRAAAGFGLAARFHAVRADRFALSTELAAGYAFGAVALPVAVRLFDQTWLYANPRLGNIGRDLAPGVPLGISVRIWEGFFVRSEAQLSWADFKYYNRRLHLAFGVAAQW